MKYRRILTTVLTLVICGQIVSAQDKREEALSNVERFGRALVNIHNNYIDTVDFDKLTDAALTEVVKKLDPHSTFIPKDEVEAANEPLQGQFEGVGIEFALINDTLSVQAVIVGGPAEAVGLRAGDKILTIDGENVAGVGLTNDGVRTRLRGPKGTKVAVGVKRSGVSNDMTFTVERNKIPLTSIDASYWPEPGVLYIKLSRFAATSIEEFLNAIISSDQMPDAMIMDLRGNGGGYLQVAIMLANQFLSRGERIVYTEGRASQIRQEYANGMGIFQHGPVVLLVDENSASASEILSGAIQDWDRGIIIGRRTFGKGLVQQLFTLSDGSQLRLTVARYHTPSGRVIQSPYEDGHRDEYYDKLRQRYANGELFSADSISFPDSLKFETLKLGRPIYGGGGIMPDIFIPEDTTGINHYINSVVGKGMLTEYANMFCDENRAKIVVEGRSFEDFYRDYDAMESKAYDGLIRYCEDHGLSGTEEEKTQCAELLKTRLKALVARMAYGTTGYYRVINIEEDPEFARALEVIHNWSDPLPL